MALARAQRLTDAERLRYVLRRGAHAAFSGARISVMRSSVSRYRVAVTTPKAVDKRATVRNTLRRRATAILRPIVSSFPVPTDVVLVFEKGAATLSFPELRVGIEAIFHKAAQSL